MYAKIFFSVILAYLLVGLVRNAMCWRGHRAEIMTALAHNSHLEDLCLPPWLEWALHVLLWPLWLPDYKRWRTETKLIKAGERHRAKGSNA